MSLALLHRRLVAGMALAALAAFAAGAGVSLTVFLAGVALAFAVWRLPPQHVSVWIERASRVGILALCAWMFYVAFGLRQDFMPAVLAMLLFLLATESLRSLEARNDMRLYSLSFALLIAATAYYPGLGFAAAFIAYVALATLGMMVGYLRRRSEEFRIDQARIGRRFLVTTAALSGVTLLMSGALFVIFPRLPRQWNVQGRRGGGEMMAGFSDEVRLGQHGGRIVPNPEVAFRVEFPDGPPPGGMDGIRWRGRGFDHFDGERWTRSRGVQATGLMPQQYGVKWGGPFTRVRIFGGPEGANVLFGPHPVLQVQPRSAIRTIRDGTGDLLYFGSDVPVYTLLSAAPAPPQARLRAAVGRDDPDLAPYYQLPGLSPRVRALADSLTAGAAARVDKVLAVERYFHREFGYTLDMPATRAQATVEGFLFRRREGHCEYFATAMVVLLRSVGIPARNVTGFLGGRWNQNGQYLAVTGNDAHAWVEVWFPEYGWVAFDPTPPGRADAIERERGESWTWPALFWFDGIEYRWYKWVIDYNLEKQLEVFRGVGELFRRDPARPGGGGGGMGGAVPWAVGAGAVVVLVWFGRGRRRVVLRPEQRAYLGVRRAYRRAGWAPAEDEAGPLDFAEALDRGAAPGAESARRVVDLYLRARFAGQEIGDQGRAEMDERARETREALRRAKRERKKQAGV